MEENEWNEQLRKKYYEWATDDQWQCCLMIFDIIGGEHHLTGKIKEWGTGICYNTRNHSLATFDYNLLTKIVFMSHDRMIRFGIEPSGPGMLKWCLWKRHKRQGSLFERHPTIKTALLEYRKYYREPTS